MPGENCKFCSETYMKTFDNFGYGTEEDTADLGKASPSPNAVRKGSQAGRIAELDKFWKLFSALCISRCHPCSR